MTTGVMENRGGLGARLRYRIGKSAIGAVDFLIVHRLLPFGTRFPIGIRLHHDLNRFLGHQPGVIVDAGANVGQTALAFARYWPQASIHSFEPVGASYEKLCASCAALPAIKCYRYALGDAERETSIALQENSELNSLASQDVQVTTAASERIRVRRLDDWAAEQGVARIDLLKMDVEGYELQVLEGATGLLRAGKIDAVFAECRFLRNDTPQVLFQDLDLRLTDAGLLFSGFYDSYRWGPSKRWTAFANGLWLLPGEKRT
jgi:FkbM family methyltransferase